MGNNKKFIYTQSGAPPLELSEAKLKIYQRIASRNDVYPKMTRMAAFACGIYGGDKHNSDKTYSLIRGYKMIKQWGMYKMGLFHKPNTQKYVLAIRGTQGGKDICSD